MKLRLGVSEAISHWAKFRSEKICLRNEKFTISYKQLNSILNTIAIANFSTNQVEECIHLVLENKLLLLCSIIAASRSGKSVAIINPNLKKEEIEFALNTLKASSVYTENKILGRLPNSKTINVLTEELITNTNIDNFIDQEWEPPKLDNNWGTLYSSGTTGNPKGMFRSHFSILSELLGWCFELGLQKDSHCYIARPIFYTGGLVLSLATLLVGGKVSIFESFTPEIYYKYLNLEDIDLAFFVPDQIKQLVKFVQETNLNNFKAAKAIFSMGAPFPETLKKDANVFLKSDIIESWGNTEGLGTITQAEDLYKRPSSIGRPFIADKLIIVDENGERLASNSIGRIAGEVDSRFTEYINNDILNRELIKGDLIISEDLGMEDEDGYFYLYGRVADVINTLSGKIYPILIEKVISTFDEVDEVAVFGIPNCNFEEPVCVINCKTSISNEELVLEKINSHLEDSQQIKQLKIIKEFPKTASGKIKKTELIYLFNEKR